MSMKKVSRQSTLASFFKKTPSKDFEVQTTPRQLPSSPLAPSSVVSTPTPTRQGLHRATKGVSTPIDEESSDFEEADDAFSSARPHKRRKTARLNDSEDEYSNSLDDDDMLEAEALSSATTTTTRSNKITAHPPPRIALDTSTSSQKLASFMSTPKLCSDVNDDPSSDMQLRSEKSEPPPTLLRETSSRVSAIVPMSKQDQLVEGGYEWLKPGNIRDADGNKQGTPEYNPRTLYIPKSASSQFGNFEKQFWEHKSQNFDSIVFFQKGKFYELYEEDAVIAHQLFDWKMSGGRAGSLRMAGVPDYTFDIWAGQFIAKGYRVARVDQMESILGKDLRDRAAGAKKEKIVRRELTQVLTQGTLVDANMLLSEMSTFLMSIKETDCDTDSAAPSFGAAFCDTATGMFYYSSFKDDLARTKLDTLLSQLRPRELVLEKGRMTPASTKAMKSVLSTNAILNWIKPEDEFWDSERACAILKESNYFDNGNIPAAAKEMFEDDASGGAFGGLLWYLKKLKLDADLCSLGNFQSYDPLQARSSLVLDGQSLVNLDIFTNENGGSEGTLFSMINQCVTPFGKRMLKLWTCHPLQKVSEIDARLDVVDLLNSRIEIRDIIEHGLVKLPDLERMISRIHCGRCKVIDFVKVLGGFENILLTLSQLHETLSSGSLLSAIVAGAPDMTSTMDYFRTAFDWTVARGSKDEKGKHIPGSIIPTPGAEQEFDDSEANIQAIEAAFHPLLKQYQRDLKSSKIRFINIGQSKEINQIEVPASIKVPRDWSQLSATKAVTRYWSPAVKKLVTQLHEARELHKTLVDGLEQRFYQKFDRHYKSWSSLVQAVAKIDCLYSLAKSSQALSEPNCRPAFVEADRSVLDFKSLRHPCISDGSATSFIPNDISLGGDRPCLSLLTGPNMAGKSTLLRSTCIGVILAQLGHYVPAAWARLTPIDQVSVRTGGAKDNIAGAQSTFMVELNETSTILNSATNRSLVILDELGRGTSTYDGMAIACSVLHHLATFKGCLGFFSTHYSNLVDEFRCHPEVKFQNMDFMLGRDGTDVTFLYKLVDGICSHSHGLNVARMAGIDEDIIETAAQASKDFDAHSSLQGASSDTGKIPLGLLTDLERLLANEVSEIVNQTQLDTILHHARLAMAAA